MHETALKAVSVCVEDAVNLSFFFSAEFPTHRTEATDERTTLSQEGDADDSTSSAAASIAGAVSAVLAIALVTVAVVIILFLR